jgi:plastocyanin
MRRLAAVLGLAVLGFAGLAAGIFATGGGANTTAVQATTKVTVVATEFKFVLSKRSVSAGTVIFTVRNKGKIAHDFKIAGRKTPTIQPGRSAVLRVAMKKGRFQYICTLPGHAKAGMKGAFVAGSATGPPPPPPPTTTTTTTTTTVPGPSTTVNVDMFEYRFDISPSTIPSGTVTFVITNKGSEPHNFDIAGVRAGAIIGPGQSETWTVGLPARAYIIVCDVPFHVDRGMTTNMIVS